MTATVVYWSVFYEDDIELHLAASDKGLCTIIFPNESFAGLNLLVRKQFPQATLVRANEQLRPYALQLDQYFRRQRTRFELPLDMQGTPFQVSVWEALLRIPYGEVRSYSDIAHTLGNPKAVRAVGAANGRNPLPIIVPCHRVIGKSGALTGFRGGLGLKKRLLRLEGIEQYDFAGHARFDF